MKTGPPDRGPPKIVILLIGGGHANVQVLEILSKNLSREVLSGSIKIILVSDQKYSWYSGMLPGCIAKFYTKEQIRMNLEDLCLYYDAEFLCGKLISMEPERRIVVVEFATIESQGLMVETREIPFTIASINIGSITKGSSLLNEVAQRNESIITTRPISQLLTKVEAFERTLPSPEKAKAMSSLFLSRNEEMIEKLSKLRVIVIGGGAAGIELAFAFKTRLQPHATEVSVTLVSGKETITPHFGSWMKSNIDTKLAERRIEMISGLECSEIDPKHNIQRITLTNGVTLDFDLLIWATGPSAPPVLQKLGLSSDEEGYLKVLQTLQSESAPFVFGAGDCVTVANCPWVQKAGVYAVREGRVVADNILRILRNQPLQQYEPQKGFLSLIMTGDGEAISAWKGMSFKGTTMWKLKDKIDSDFMNRFDVSKLPPKSSFQSLN